MDVLKGFRRVDITIPVTPEFELRLVSLSVPESVPTAADFDGNRLEIGHARFAIFSEAGEISTAALLYVEYTAEDHTPVVAAWRLVVVPRPPLGPLAGAMERLVMVEGEEAIRRQALRGGDVYPNLRGA
jgi:hypothetical protein